MASILANPAPAQQPAPQDEIGKIRALQTQFGLPMGLAALPALAHPAAQPPAPPVVAPATPAAGSVAPAGPAATPPTPRPSPPPSQSAVDQQAAQDERQREEATGSGISQVKNPILRTLGRIGDIAGSVLAPGLTAAVPGTTLHHEVLLNQLDKRIATDQGQQEKAAQIADAERVANEPLPESPNVGKTVESNGRILEFDPATESYDRDIGPAPQHFSGGSPGFVTNTGTGATVPVAGAVPAGAKPVTLNIGGSAVPGYTVPGKGTFTEDGKPVPHATVYEKPGATAGKLVTGTLNGKPAFAEFEPGTGFVDPVTRQPISGFAPVSASDHMTGMGFYALSRILQEETGDNPALRALVPSLLDKLGIPLTPEQKAQLSAVPQGQPQNEAGEFIGTRMPGAPTSTTRSAGQVAQRVLAEIPRVRQEIASLSPDLGPIAGRWNQFMTGAVGTGGADGEKYAQLRGDVHFLTSAAAKFHLNSVRAVAEFNRLADTGKMTKQVLNGFIDAVEPWAVTAARQGEGLPASAQPGAKGSSTPSKPAYKVGDTFVYKGSRVKVTGIKDGHYQVVPAGGGS